MYIYIYIYIHTGMYIYIPWVCGPFFFPSPSETVAKREKTTFQASFQASRTTSERHRESIKHGFKIGIVVVSSPFREDQGFEGMAEAIERIWPLRVATSH